MLDVRNYFLFYQTLLVLPCVREAGGPKLHKMLLRVTVCNLRRSIRYR